MAVLALGVAGAALGGTVGFASLGWVVGTTLGTFLFAQKGPKIIQEGPQLNDLRVQASTWGSAIPLLYADSRSAGNVIWSTGLIATQHSDTQRTGGKGMGGGGGGVTNVTYTYAVKIAIGLGRGPITGIRKIWASGRLIYDVGDTTDVYTIIASNANASGFRVYIGDEFQFPDPIIEADVGPGNAPAHRGMAYVVFDDFQLAEYGNAVPNFTFEVIKSGSLDVLQTPVVWTGSIGGATAVDSEWNGAGAIFTAYNNGIARFNPATGTPIGTNDYVAQGIGSFTCSSFTMFGMAPRHDGTMFMIVTGGLNSIGMVFIQRVDENGKVIGVWWAGGLSFSLGSRQLGYGADGWLYYAQASSGVVYGFPESSAQISNPSAPPTSHVGVVGGGTDGIGGITFISSPISQGSGRVGFVGQNATTYFACFPVSGSLNAHSLGLSISANVGVGVGIVWDHLGTPWLSWEDTTPSNHPTLNQLDIDTGAVLRTIELPNGAFSTLRNFFFSVDGFLYTYDGTNFTKRDYASGEALHVSTVVGNVTNIYPTAWANILQVGSGGTTMLSLNILEPLPRLTATSVTTVADVVEDLCSLAGLGPSDIDVSALTDILDGYSVARVGSARAAIEPLEKAYFFDAVESDSVLKFVKRGASSAITIPFIDLVVGDGNDDPFSITRTQDQELPRQISFNYLNKDGDYLPATEYARRLVTMSDSDALEEMPLALSPQHAAQIADSWLYDAYTQRHQFKFRTSRKYAKYEPTDVVTVTNEEGTTYPIHLRRKRDAGPTIHWEGVAADAPVYTSHAVGGSDQDTAPGVAFAGPTRLDFLDIAILRDVDDNAGMYVPMSGYVTGWTGATLFDSNDGLAFTEKGSVLNAATTGAASTALANWTGGNFWDEANQVTVVLSAGAGTLSSATALEVMNGANPAILGDEIIQFRTASFVSGTTYTLKGLLRGRKGTEWAQSTHAIGDRFVMLTLAGTLRPVLAVAQCNIDRQYKAVSFGEDISAAVVRTFKNTAAGLKPLAPVHFNGVRHNPANNDWYLSWVRRGRMTAEWLDSIEVPLGETTEAYEVDICNVSSGAVIRTLTSTTATVTYTAAQQATDFSGFPQTTIRARVYQMSSSIGRGFVNDKVFS